VKERSEYLPGRIELVITDKVAVVALEGIEDERFVCLGDLEVRESAAVGKVELSHDCLHAEARLLGVHLDIDGFVGLDADDDLVARNVLEDTGGNVLEM